MFGRRDVTTMKGAKGGRGGPLVIEAGPDVVLRPKGEEEKK
jgi:hypothetical protein